MFLQIGGAPTQKLTERQLTIMCKLAGPNIEADGKSAYNNVQVGERGPNTEADKSQHTIMCKLGNGAPT
ncbi:hypothetical protein ASU36_09530 [Staphylococcus aureus]|nr:hypothetical protein ASU36_09530 [Staphylococcus aureus]